MGGSDEKLCFSELERGNVWKGYIEGIMNEKNVEVDAVEGPVVCENRKKPWTFRSITRVNCC